MLRRGHAAHQHALPPGAPQRTDQGPPAAHPEAAVAAKPLRCGDAELRPAHWVVQWAHLPRSCWNRNLMWQLAQLLSKLGCPKN